MEQGTGVKNSIHALLSRRNVCLPVANIFGKKGLSPLSSLDLPEPARSILDHHLATLSFITEMIGEADVIIREKYRESKEVEFLSALPGVGIILSLTILFEIG